jgi:hypothetical protein
MAIVIASSFRITRPFPVFFFSVSSPFITCLFFFYKNITLLSLYTLFFLVFVWFICDLFLVIVLISLCVSVWLCWLCLCVCVSVFVYVWVTRSK